MIAIPDDSALIVTVKDSSLAEGGKLVWQANSGQAFEFFITANYLDCQHDWKGTAKIDNCDVCAGGKTGYLSCSAITTVNYKI